MLDCEVKNGWAQFIEFIETRCSSAEFENWIAPILLIEAGSEQIILEVPNPFVQEYLLDNFKDVLCNFLPLKPSGEPAIHFRTASAKPKAAPLSAPPEPAEEAPATHEVRLNPLYVFENFIEGPSNQFVKS